MVTNALRLNLFKIHDAGRDKKRIPKAKRSASAPEAVPAAPEESCGTGACRADRPAVRTVTLKVKGMMCEHCEAHVKEALEKLDGVESASASHTEGIAVAALSKEVDRELLKTAVEAEGYEVLSISGNDKKEMETMTKTMKIEGMMCPMCEAHTKKALEAIDGVENAVASHEAGTAVVTLTKNVDSAVLTKAVEDAGYKVISVD